MDFPTYAKNILQPQKITNEDVLKAFAKNNQKATIGIFRKSNKKRRIRESSHNKKIEGK